MVGASMNTDIEDFTIDFPCPSCNHEFPVSIYQLFDGGVVVCPRCLATNVESELVGMEQSLEFFDKALQNLKKCVERKARNNS